MPGTCAFVREGGVWYMTEDCGAKGCPPLANFKKTRSTTEVPTRPGDEGVFLATFQAAFGAAFAFEENDHIVLVCGGVQVPEPKSSYRRAGQVYKEFWLREVPGQTYRRVEVAGS